MIQSFHKCWIVELEELGAVEESELRVYKFFQHFKSFTFLQAQSKIHDTMV